MSRDSEWKPSAAEDPEEELIQDPQSLPSSFPSQDPESAILPEDEELEIDRLLSDASYLPTKRVAGTERMEGESEFQRARREHDRAERPLHVQKAELEGLAFWCASEERDFLLAVEIDAPKTEADWKKILKEPSKFSQRCSRKVLKSVGTSFLPLNGQQCLKQKGWKLNRGSKRVCVSNFEGSFQQDV